MSYETTKTLGQRLKLARTNCGLTQEQLANGVRRVTNGKHGSKPSISLYEADKVMPGSVVMLALAAVTGYSDEWLFSGKGPQRTTGTALRAITHNSNLRQVLVRSIELSAEAHREPAYIAAGALAVFETLLDEPDTPRGALLRIAKSASPA